MTPPYDFLSNSTRSMRERLQHLQFLLTDDEEFTAMSEFPTMRVQSASQTSPRQSGQRKRAVCYFAQSLGGAPQ